MEKLVVDSQLRVMTVMRGKLVLGEIKRLKVMKEKQVLPSSA